MIKLLLKIVWIVVVIAALLLAVYFLFANEGAGIGELKDLFSTGIWEGIKQFFINMWNGFKFVCGIN